MRKVEIVKCQCGDEVCRAYGLNIGVFDQGNGFEKEEAQLIADLLNAHEQSHAETVLRFSNMIDDLLLGHAATLRESNTQGEAGKVLRKQKQTYFELAREALMRNIRITADVMAAYQARSKFYEINRQQRLQSLQELINELIDEDMKKRRQQLAEKALSLL